MATATGVSIEEYLHTDYEPDCDYVDGSYFQAALCACLFAQRRKLGFHVFAEQRVRVSKTRFRMPRKIRAWVCTATESREVPLEEILPE